MAEIVLNPKPSKPKPIALKRILRDIGACLDGPDSIPDFCLIDRGNIYDSDDVVNGEGGQSGDSGGGSQLQQGYESYSYWIKVALRGCPMVLRFPSSYPFTPFRIDPCSRDDEDEKDDSSSSSSSSSYIGKEALKLSQVLAIANYGDASYIKNWSPSLTLMSLLSKPFSTEEERGSIWIDEPPYRNHCRIDSFIKKNVEFSFPTSTTTISSISSGYKDNGHIHSGISKKTIITITRYNESTDAVKCPIILDNAFTSEEMKLYVKCAEHLKFDNARHERYQNTEIDMSELRYRENDRVVYVASAEEVQFLNNRFAHFLPDSIPWGSPSVAAACGSWEKVGMNNIWRFYRYKAEDSEEEAMKNGQKFPIHCDNAMVKSTELISAMSVLIYLSDDSTFSGGETLFAGDSDGSTYKTCLVSPNCGSVLAFWHVGRLVGRGDWLCPMHAGMPLWNKKRSNEHETLSINNARSIPPPSSNGTFPQEVSSSGSGGGAAVSSTGPSPTCNYKYVLRTDLMFRRIEKSSTSHNFDLSPPYSGKR